MWDRPSFFKWPVTALRSLIQPRSPTTWGIRPSRREVRRPALPRARYNSTIGLMRSSRVPLTVLLAAAVLHERVEPLQKTGIVLTLTGVVLISV